MTHPPRRLASAVPDEADVGDRHVVAAAFAARADTIVTNNVRHFAPDRLADVWASSSRPRTNFLVHQGWLDPEGVGEVLASMAAPTGRPALTAAQVLDSLRRFAPELVNLVERGSSPLEAPAG